MTSTYFNDNEMNHVFTIFCQSLYRVKQSFHGIYMNSFCMDKFYLYFGFKNFPQSLHKGEYSIKTSDLWF